MMRKLIVSVTSIGVLFAVASGVALAQSSPSYPPPAQTPPSQQVQPAQTTPGSTGQVPSVSNLKPFSIEANFMSLAGYLRYLMHQQTGQWMTYAEAQRAVRQGQ